MNQAAINAIDFALAKTDALMKTDSDPLLRSFHEVLQGYRRLVTDHWPLSKVEKEDIDIGRVAMREVHHYYPDYATTLSRLGAVLREELAP